MQNDIIIADASSIIALEKSGLLFLLKEIYSIITVTPQVAREIQMPLPNWMQVKEPANSAVMLQLLHRLDEGEASSIALAAEHSDCLLIIDEKEGRKGAQTLYIKIISTLAVLPDAKRYGLIGSFKECMMLMINNGFRVSARLAQHFLKAAGEE